MGGFRTFLILFSFALFQVGCTLDARIFSLINKQGSSTHSETPIPGAPTVIPKSVSFDQSQFLVNQATSANVPLTGTCQDISTIFFKVASVAVGQASCTNGSWSHNFDFSLATPGTITIMAYDSDGTSLMSTLVGTKDTSVSGPSYISLQFPSSNFSTSSSPVYRLSSLEVGATVTVYGNSGCTVALGSKFATGITEDVTLNVPTQSVYPIYAKQTDAAGNVSSCSDLGRFYYYAKEFNVTSAATATNADAGINGICSDSGGQCSLQAAIDEANADALVPWIFNLNAGTYVWNSSQIVSPRFVKIVGASASTTIIQGNTTASFISGPFSGMHFFAKDIQFKQFSGGTSDIFSNIGSNLYDFNTVIFQSNAAGTYGVVAARSTTTITNCTFDGTTGGPAVYSWNGTTAITGSLFTNTAVSYALRLRGGLNTVESSLFTSNPVAIYADRPVQFILRNSTLTNNSTAGIDAVTSTSILTWNVYNSTFYNNGSASNGNLNVAGGTGGGSLTINLYNTILAINGTKANCNTMSGAYTLNFQKSILDEVSCGAAVGGNLFVNPLLSALGNNGGPTQTMKPQTGSPAIDGGAIPCPTVDQRGLARPIQKTGGSAICDIGAVELQLSE